MKIRYTTVCYKEMVNITHYQTLLFADFLSTLNKKLLEEIPSRSFEKIIKLNATHFLQHAFASDPAPQRTSKLARLLIVQYVPCNGDNSLEGHLVS